MRSHLLERHWHETFAAQRPVEYSQRSHFPQVGHEGVEPLLLVLEPPDAGGAYFRPSQEVTVEPPAAHVRVRVASAQLLTSRPRAQVCTAVDDSRALQVQESPLSQQIPSYANVESFERADVHALGAKVRLPNPETHVHSHRVLVPLQTKDTQLHVVARPFESRSAQQATSPPPFTSDALHRSEDVSSAVAVILPPTHRHPWLDVAQLTSASLAPLASAVLAPHAASADTSTEVASALALGIVIFIPRR